MGTTQQSFNDLFSSSGKSYVHYVDTVYEYTNKDYFKDNVSFDAYLNNIQNPTVAKVDPAVVKARIDNTPMPTSQKTSWESWQRDTVEVIYNLQSPQSFTSSPSSLVKEIIAGVDPVKDVNKSHTRANAYMDQIMFSIGKWKYNDVKSKLVATYTVQSNYSGLEPNLRTAIGRIGNMVGQTESLVLAELRKACVDALDYWVKDKPANRYLMTGLSEGAAFKDTFIRNALRDIIYKTIYFQAVNEPNDAVLQYMKRVLADLFIICFYPYIHFIYANQLQNYFIKRGDFINMRAATHAKIMVVYHSIQHIISYGTDTKFASPTLTSTEVSQLQSIQTNLYSYLDSLRNPVFDEPTKTFGDIDVEVRELAQDVHKLNLSIDELKKWIKEAQLQIRSHSNIYRGIDGVLKSKRIQYVLHIVFLILLVVVVSMMIKFNIYLDMTIYALAFIIIFFILVRLVSIIISLL